MYPLKKLEAGDQLRYDYLDEVFKSEFEVTYLQYHSAAFWFTNCGIC